MFISSPVHADLPYIRDCLLSLLYYLQFHHKIKSGLEVDLDAGRRHLSGSGGLSR